MSLRTALAIAAVVGSAAVLGTIVLRDPDAPLALATVVGGLAVGIGATAARLLLGAARRRGGRGARAREGARRALRRGAELGACAGLLVALRAADGLTPLTAGFVILGLGLAEVALTARAS